MATYNFRQSIAIAGTQINTTGVATESANCPLSFVLAESGTLDQFYYGQHDVTDAGVAIDLFATPPTVAGATMYDLLGTALSDFTLVHTITVRNAVASAENLRVMGIAVLSTGAEWIELQPGEIFSISAPTSGGWTVGAGVRDLLTLDCDTGETATADVWISGSHA